MFSAFGLFMERAPKQRHKVSVCEAGPKINQLPNHPGSECSLCRGNTPPLKNNKAGLSSGLIEMRTKLLNSLVNWCGAADIRH